MSVVCAMRQQHRWPCDLPGIRITLNKPHRRAKNVRDKSCNYRFCEQTLTITQGPYSLHFKAEVAHLFSTFSCSNPVLQGSWPPGIARWVARRNGELVTGKEVDGGQNR